jgi:hypothetical protein
MTISFKLTPRDYLDYSWYHLKKRASIAWLIYGALFCYFICIVLIEYRSGRASGQFISTIMIFICLLFFKILFSWSKPGVKKVLEKVLWDKKNIGLYCPMNLTFEEECIISRTEFGESIMNGRQYTPWMNRPNICTSIGFSMMHSLFRKEYLRKIRICRI